MNGNKIKILFIWHAGVVRSYQKYIEALAENTDLDITLLTPRTWIEGSREVKAYVPEKGSYKVIAGKTIGPKDPLIAVYPYLPIYLKQIKPDLIHLFEEPWHNIAAYLLFWKKIFSPGSKLIFQTFQNQIDDYKLSWKIIQNWTFRESSAAIANAEEMKKVLIHWGYNKPIHVIYPGVETSLYHQTDSRKLRNRLGIKEFTIGYFGRMVKEKGIEDLLRCAEKLPYNVQFLFIGDGPDRDYFKTLTNKAVWLDAVEPEALPDYYSALDCFVLPSRTTRKWKEQFGRVLVEAMLCQIPVIGSSSGEIPRIIGSGGLVFREGDADDLALKIASLRGDFNFRRNLVEKGLIRARKFDWQQTAKSVYSVYQQALK